MFQISGEKFPQRTKSGARVECMPQQFAVDNSLHALLRLEKSFEVHRSRSRRSDPVRNSRRRTDDQTQNDYDKAHNDSGTLLDRLGRTDPELRSESAHLQLVVKVTRRVSVGGDAA